ncbi:MAG: hypothetical protein Q4D16_02125 [Eubacteriales bacterium]|nr:hypothetical protein [Eubacteriales bacterium]
MKLRIRNKIKSRLGYHRYRTYKDEILKPYLECEREYKKWVRNHHVTELDLEQELWEYYG